MKNSYKLEDKKRALVHLMPPARRLAAILTRSPEKADDLAQEALVLVWSQLQGGADIQDLRPYLMTTLRNANRVRRDEHQPLTETNTPGVPGDAFGRMACHEVNSAIADLPANLRDLLNQVVQNGATYQELATSNAIPIGTVMSRLSRARSQLRAELDLPQTHAVEALLDEAS